MTAPAGVERGGVLPGSQASIGINRCILDIVVAVIVYVAAADDIEVTVVGHAGMSHSRVIERGCRTPGPELDRNRGFEGEIGGNGHIRGHIRDR